MWRVYDPKDTAPLTGHRTKLLEAADGALWIIGRGEEAVRLDLSEMHYQTYEGLIFRPMGRSGLSHRTTALCVMTGGNGRGLVWNMA